ncbi:Lag2p [Lachancea thermotolerans CBS 6340]|uniref:KLTH0H13618p n=1 Tax=Lachancea thermotolerans (strain ATCC 56472 / CBS 6340 / NRRL Y-8284) TaxID=559295 RepID=C5E3H5_LACTC|nr:KLTH0H13618p [Lachancea thermotolerans CBS 6340]CAR30586.1 KLTH0H13618p [Lachancea thermotolerans CBS 6340]
MLLSDIIDQYFSTQDHDLRYMALREHILNARDRWSDVQLQGLVSRVLIPALSDRDTAIVELVSTQVFPHVAALHPLETEPCIILPLCQRLRFPPENLELARQEVSPNEPQDRPQVLQSLRNVLSTFKSPLVSPQPLDIYCNCFQRMLERPYLAWETLGLLIQLSEDLHVIETWYARLYMLALQDGRLTAMNAMQIATGRVSPNVILQCLKQAGPFTEAHARLLSQITQEHAAFRLCYGELVQLLLQQPLTETVCLTLANLSVWLQQPAIEAASPMKSTLADALFGRCCTILSSASEMNQPPLEDEDPTQDSYLKQLSDVSGDEDNEYEFEDEEDDEAALAPKLCLQLLRLLPLQIPQYVIDRLESPNLNEDALLELIGEKAINLPHVVSRLPKAADRLPIDKMPLNVLEVLPSLPSVQKRIAYFTESSILPSNAPLILANTIIKDAEHINENTANCLVEVLNHHLNLEVADLEQYQLAIDAAASAAKRSEVHHLHDHIAQMVWPHLKPNKAFIRTIKVGNMKQAIDDGVSFRLNCYTLLQQLDLSYTAQCVILQECAERGFKDESSIKEAAAELFTKVLELAWPNIRIRDATWFVEHLCPRVQDRVQKLLSAEPQATATQHQIADWARGLKVLEHVELVTGDIFNIVKNDLDCTFMGPTV